MSRAGFFPGSPSKDMPDYLGGTAPADDFWGASKPEQESLVQAPAAMDANALVTGTDFHNTEIDGHGVQDASPATVAELGRIEAVIEQAKAMGIDTAGIDETTIARVRQSGKIDGADSAALQQAMMGANAVEASVNQQQMVQGFGAGIALAGGMAAMMEVPGGLGSLSANTLAEVQLAGRGMTGLFNRNADGTPQMDDRRELYTYADISPSMMGELSPQNIGVGQKQDGLQIG